MNRNIFLFLTGALIFLSACSMAPDYTRPDAPVPAAWPTGDAYDVAKTVSDVPAAAGMTWQEVFTDERLRKVIDMALQNNRDLSIATLNVEKARGMYGIARADLYPVINITGSGGRARIPADLSSSGSATTVEEYSVYLGMTSWEIDFFGRVRSLKDRALEEFFASGQSRRSVRISIISSVAGAYMTLAADREALRLSRSTLQAQEATYTLIRKRYTVGLSSELDLHRAQTQVDTARGDVARISQLVALDENALNLLVGSPVPEELQPSDLETINSPAEVSAGLSSEVLLLRPDVMAAEHRLRAANATIGAARAALFPRIALTAAYGSASSDMYNLFNSSAESWNFQPQIKIPIFDARAWSAYDVSKVEKDLAVAEYERTIQTAFREVADTLAVRGTVQRRIDAQQSLVRAVSATYRLSSERYARGIDSYLGVLDAQRSLYAAQQGLIALRLSRMANLVTLYKVLGGGA